MSWCWDMSDQNGAARAWAAVTGCYRGQMRQKQSNAKFLEKSLGCEILLGYLGGDGFEGHTRNFGRESQVASRWGLGDGCSR